jgi:hypothetical protein
MPTIESKSDFFAPSFRDRAKPYGIAGITQCMERNGIKNYDSKDLII